MDLLTKRLKQVKKPILCINENGVDVSSLFQNPEIINISLITNAEELKEAFDNHIYPAYSIGKNSLLYLNESLDGFNKRVMDFMDLEHEFPFYAEKVAWHLNRNFFIVNFAEGYKLHETLLTPIEIILRDEMIRNNIDFEIQKEIGVYIVDFLVNFQGKKFIVECDGKDFHDKEKDQTRDAEIFKKFGLVTLRFTGSEIFNDPKKCVSKIIKYVKEGYVENKYTREIGVMMAQNYDSKQVNAINHLWGSCLVLAPAGSGKTSVLIQRIIELIRRGVDPKRILAISFTRKAREEIQNRLKDVLGDMSDDIEIKTYHGLAYKYLVQNREMLTTGNEWQITKYLIQISKEYKNLKVDELINLSHKKLLQEKLSHSEIQLLHLYKEALDSNNLFTFDMLLIELLNKLEYDIKFRQSMQNKFDFILIDECQDNNKTEQLITEIIAAPQDNTFWVGDDDQCIFTFAGSSIANILEIKNKYPSVNEVFLEYNYRSNPKIVEAATNVIVSNNKRKLKVIKAGKEKTKGKAVEYYSFKSAKEEAKFIVEYCKKNASAENNIAVLYRKKYYIQNLILELEENEIEFYMKDKINLLADGRIKKIHSYLMCLNGKNERDYWITMLRHGMPYIKNIDAERIFRSVDKVKAIKELIEDTDQAYMRNSWSDFLERYTLMRTKIMSGKQASSSAQQEGCFNLLDAIQYINTTLNILNENDDNDDIKEKFECYLTYAKRYKSLDKFNEKIVVNKKDEDESIFNILLFTIHSSKGKQFPEVFFVGLNEGILPSIRKDESLTEEDEEEERRVCYVGMTRAESKIFMCNTETDGEPSRFIEESKEAKMRCNVCSKNIPKKHNLRCNACSEYFCPDHLTKCHVCGKSFCDVHIQECACGNPICEACNSIKCSDCNTSICPDIAVKCELCSKSLCIDHGYKCSVTGKYYCNDHLQKCSECGKKLSPSETRKCGICGKSLCSEHAYKCSVTGNYHCQEHIVQCNTCSKDVSTNSIVTCEWCDETQCKSCYEIKRCKTCGLEYCNKCVDEQNNQCEACRNIVKLSKTELISQGYRDIFGDKTKITVGLGTRYIVYYKKKFFGLLNDSIERYKK